MTETELAALCAAITPPDEAARAAAHAHWASLAKPLGGLGGLETTIEDAAALTGSAKLDISRRAVLVLCADNGVVAQGVSQTDSSVTRAVAENLAARRTSVCRMAQTARCEVVPVDMGIAGDPVPGVLDCRIAPGTADFTLGPAMSRAEAVEAIGRGIRLVQEQKKAGVGLLATGEMGIGNTTTSSAVASVLLGRPVAEMTGRGAGLSDAGLHRKIDAIERGIARNHPDAADPLGVLAALGGFDIAGLCGVFLGGALERLPIVMDGFISGVAALCAGRLCPPAEKAAAAAGVTAVQLRAPDWKKRLYAECGRELLKVLAPYDVPLFINDHADVAVAIGAHGVHVGQSDLSPEDCHRLMTPGMMLGLSVSNVSECLGVDPALVDYIGIGPYRATPTKKDAAAEIGLSGLTNIVSRAPCPSVAIGDGVASGGIRPADVGSVMQSGVDGVAVVSAICGTPDIPASVKALLDAMPS